MNYHLNVKTFPNTERDSYTDLVFVTMTVTYCTQLIVHHYFYPAPNIKNAVYAVYHESV